LSDTETRLGPDRLTRVIQSPHSPILPPLDSSDAAEEEHDDDDDQKNVQQQQQVALNAQRALYLSLLLSPRADVVLQNDSQSIATTLRYNSKEAFPSSLLLVTKLSLKLTNQMTQRIRTITTGSTLLSQLILDDDNNKNNNNNDWKKRIDDSFVELVQWSKYAGPLWKPACALAIARRTDNIQDYSQQFEQLVNLFETTCLSQASTHPSIVTGHDIKKHFPQLKGSQISQALDHALAIQLAALQSSSSEEEQQQQQQQFHDKESILEAIANKI
jgi:hypothetical protein